MICSRLHPILTRKLACTYARVCLVQDMIDHAWRAARRRRVRMQDGCACKGVGVLCLRKGEHACVCALGFGFGTEALKHSVHLP